MEKFVSMNDAASDNAIILTRIEFADAGGITHNDKYIVLQYT